MSPLGPIHENFALSWILSPRLLDSQHGSLRLSISCSKKYDHATMLGLVRLVMVSNLFLRKMLVEGSTKILDQDILSFPIFKGCCSN